MFCNSCGKKIDDDSLFCSECGAKINRIAIDSISSDKVKVSLAKPSGNNTDEKNQENENSDLSDSLYTPESNQQTEFSPKDDSVSETVPENETENFFGSTEPISHINPEPKQESVEEIQKTIDEYNNEEHKENMPKMVLKKNVEKHDENIKENHSGQFDDNQNTQYIPIDNNNNNNNYDDNYYDDEYREPFPPPYDAPPEDFPEYVGNTPYPPPQPVFQEYRPVKVGFLRLFGAGIVTFFTIIFLTLLSLLFCIKLGFSGTVLEKSIKSLDTEKILEAECDDNLDVNEYLYEKTDFYRITNKNADENDFRNFLLNLNLTDYVGENVSIYADYILNGGKKPSLTSEDVAENLFNRSGYNNLTRNDFSSMIYNLTDGEADTLLSPDEWKRKTGFDFGITSYIFSFVTLGILLAVVVVLMIWTAVIVDKRGRHLTGFYKGVFMTSGIICLLVGITSALVPPVVYSQTSHIVFYLGSKLLTEFNLFILITGGFELIAGIIFGLIKKLIVRHERKNRDG